MKKILAASFVLGVFASTAAMALPSAHPLVGFLCTGAKAVVSIDFINENPADPLSPPQKAHVSVSPRSANNGVKAHEAVAAVKIAKLPSAPNRPGVDAFYLTWAAGRLAFAFTQNESEGKGTLGLKSLASSEAVVCRVNVRFGG